MNIRQLSASDASDYQELRLFALQESPAAFGSSFEEEVNRPLEVVEERLADTVNHIFGTFGDDGRLMGTVTLRRNQHAKSAHKATIFAMYVAPDVRKQGLGRALLQAAISQARDLGLSWLKLMVNSANAEAVTLYLSTGFETYGLEQDAFRIQDDSYDAAYMTLRLI